MKPVIQARDEWLGINLTDLDNLSTDLRAKLTAGKLELSKAVLVGNQAVLKFTCDLKTAALVCDIIRSENRKADEPVSRIYINHGQSWELLDEKAVLTKVSKGKTELSPIVFPRLAKSKPLKVERI